MSSRIVALINGLFFVCFTQKRRWLMTRQWRGQQVARLAGSTTVSFVTRVLPPFPRDLWGLSSSYSLPVVSQAYLPAFTHFFSPLYLYLLSVLSTVNQQGDTVILATARYFCQLSFSFLFSSCFVMLSQPHIISRLHHHTFCPFKQKNVCNICSLRIILNKTMYATFVHYESF